MNLKKNTLIQQITMKNIYLLIVGILILGVGLLIAAVGFYANGSKTRVPLLSYGIESLFKNITTEPQRDAGGLMPHTRDAVKGADSKEEVAAKISVPKNWKKESYGDFVFDVPEDWQGFYPAIEDGYASMIYENADGETTAYLTSPPPVTGYPGYKIEKAERLVTNQAGTYKIVFWHGVPEAEGDDSYLDIIFAEQNNFTGQDRLFDPKRGIQIMSHYSGDAKDIFQKIFESVALREKWQDYSGDIFSFQYPNGWSQVSDAGLGNRHAQFFDEKNQLAAEMTCPIQETGYEGYEMTEYTRTSLQRGTMQYALDYWHGKSVDQDGADLNLILMETLTPEEGMEGGIFGTACQLIAEKPGLEEIFKRIHQSLSVHER